MMIELFADQTRQIRPNEIEPGSRSTIYVFKLYSLFKYIALTADPGNFWLY